MTKVLSCGNEILGGAHMASNCRVGMVLWHHSCFVSSFQPWAAPLKTKPLCISAGKIGALHQNLKWLIDTVICNHCFGWALEWAAVLTLVVFKRRGWGLRGGLVMGLWVGLVFAPGDPEGLLPSGAAACPLSPGSHCHLGPWSHLQPTAELSQTSFCSPIPRILPIWTGSQLAELGNSCLPSEAAGLRLA